jgi:hypothetical protein
MSKDANDGRFIAEIGVSMAVERLLREGYHVALPVIDDGYDLLAFCGRRHWRIQVKATGSSGRNSHRIRVRRGARKNFSYSPKHVDAFILVHTGTRAILCVPVSHARGAWVTFRSIAKYSDFGILKTLNN